ncbi:restriction endonuclease subunit S [Limosilactobacillus oris]|uniref:restriction endonuclease subunit S n=1 Tax=Limosilactobacillus oris TaxID=1632 RepID=UPI0032097CC6
MKCRLGDLARVSSSKRIYAKEYTTSGIPFYRGKEIIELGSGHLVSNKLFISKDRFNQIRSKYDDVPEKDDVLITAVGTIGETYLVKSRDLPFYFKDGNLIKLSKWNRQIVLPEYMYYWLNSYTGKMAIKKITIGSTQQAITIRELSDIELDLPPIREQGKIAQRLSTLDFSIDNNKHINANLYEQIKTISNSHFSYFDFSDGHIPSNWHYTSLSDVAEITTGYSYTSRELHSSKTAMATIKNFERTGGFSDKGYKEIIPQKKLKDSKMARKFDILVAHTDLTQNADIIGNAEIILDTSIYSQLIYSMDLVRVRTKATNVSQFLLSLILQGDRLKKHCLGYVNGTTVLHLSKKALKEFYIPLPNDLHELDHISKFAKAAYMNIAINIQENSMLQEAKQTLLRKFF